MERRIVPTNNLYRQNLLIARFGLPSILHMSDRDAPIGPAVHGKYPSKSDQGDGVLKANTLNMSITIIIAHYSFQV